MNDIHSLAHSKWNCKYHIVFAPKYRRKAMFGEKGREIGAILRELCKWKGVNIIEADMSRPCTYVGGDSPENERICVCWVSQRKE